MQHSKKHYTEADNPLFCNELFTAQVLVELSRLWLAKLILDVLGLVWCMGVLWWFSAISHWFGVPGCNANISNSLGRLIM